jgi:GNAT superfamily N-acetyltransferase
MAFLVRPAVAADTGQLQELIECSVRSLQAQDYSPEQLEAALRLVYGLDTKLVADGTYFVVEPVGQPGCIAGCGGWSRWRTLFGGDHWTGRDDQMLDPRCDAAKIRAFFVHPDWVRRGIGSLLLHTCERAAQQAGFTRLEMGATLTGVPLYAAHGYTVQESMNVPLGHGLVLPIVCMAKDLAGAGRTATDTVTGSAGIAGTRPLL